ncbi:MAG: TonB-dependent receptor [Desulfobacteraceae bacterium]|jgi:vitamin B12 transporter
MKTALCKYVTIAFLLIPVVTGFSFTCFGQSEEEMKALRLFYNEKDLVVTATRYPKPVSQVAENITVITSEDIEAMNAHTVSEVLNKIPGLFLSFNQDYGAYALINMQGSHQRHTLVLVDDVPWNFIFERAAQTITIPVGIIDRIEIIKGPALSAWGASLGGVVNIITKPVGDTQKPNGSIHASYGKSSSQDYRADLSGKIGKARYYMYAGVLDSDGLIKSRFSDNEHLYSKVELPLSRDINTGISIGYNDTYTGFGDYESLDVNSRGSMKSFFASPFLTARVASGLTLRFSAYFLQQESVQKSDSLGLGITGGPGELYLGALYEEKSWGAKSQLVWVNDINTLVFGMDFEKGDYDQSLNAGSFLQGMGAPPVSRLSTDNEKWAVYANDTITLGKWSLIPGIRYDHESVTSSFVSPSMGVTYVTDKNTILRGTIARGFSSPALSATLGGALFLDPNPLLKSEEIWSYQAGVESAFTYLWIRASVFLHDMKNGITSEPSGEGAPTNSICVNGGKIRRRGFEMEAETSKIYNLSLKGGLSYVDFEPYGTDGTKEMYSFFIGLKYDDDVLHARLFGYYNLYEYNNPALASYVDDFIWDLNINREIHLDGQLAIKLFAAAHNIFNGSQYPFIESRNPGRWFEAGIKFKF